MESIQIGGKIIKFDLQKSELLMKEYERDFSKGWDCLNQSCQKLLSTGELSDIQLVISLHLNAPLHEFCQTFVGMKLERNNIFGRRWFVKDEICFLFDTRITICSQTSLMREDEFLNI